MSVHRQALVHLGPSCMSLVWLGDIWGFPKQESPEVPTFTRKRAGKMNIYNNDNNNICIKILWYINTHTYTHMLTHLMYYCEYLKACPLGKIKNLWGTKGFAKGNLQNIFEANPTTSLKFGLDLERKCEVCPIFVLTGTETKKKKSWIFQFFLLTLF